MFFSFQAAKFIQKTERTAMTVMITIIGEIKQCPEKLLIGWVTSGETAQDTL
jgi:hypothetical protein